MRTPASPAAALLRTVGAAALALALGGCDAPFEPDEGPISAPSRQVVSDSAIAELGITAGAAPETRAP